jgi:hypothetical protein
VLDVLAGLGLWCGWCALRTTAWGDRLGAPSRRLAVLTVTVVVAAWPLASVHPYPPAYYNPLLGGGPAARWAVGVGWGEGLDQVAAYLHARPVIFNPPTVAVTYEDVLRAHLRAGNTLSLAQAEEADYIALYVGDLQRGRASEGRMADLAAGEPEYRVWLNNIEYARVYPGPQLPVERTVGLSFGDHLRLESVVLAPGSAMSRPGGELLLRLRWRASVDHHQLVAVVRLVDGRDRPSVQDRRSLEQAFWQGDLMAMDARLRLPRALAPGDYRLQVLVEDRASGRVLVADGDMVGFQPIAVYPAHGR